MKLQSINYIFILMLLTLLSLFSCTKRKADIITSNNLSQNSDQLISVIVQAENFINASDEVQKVKNQLISTFGEESWVAYNVNIPVAGRYKIELHASADSEGITAWMEDYIDNKDERTYNITGSIPISKSQAFTISSKDGSPLNIGSHNMKLHIKGGTAKVDWFKLTLIKKHQITPELLTQKTDGKEWKIAWSDEFDGVGLPDTTKWTYDIGNWGWGNNELQYYTENRIENARQENGTLLIEARKNDLGNEWTSARLTTRGKVSFLYGRIEFRAKVPTKRGSWSAGWTLGDKYVDELSWPYCGEIDILESVGFETDDETGDGEVHASAHSGAFYFKKNNQPTGITDVKNMNNEFHTYAVDWTPEGMTATVDGKPYFNYKDTTTPLAWPFGEAQNIIINLAMGGGWGGQKGIDETMTSQKFILDYVRVYEKR